MAKGAWAEAKNEIGNLSTPRQRFIGFGRPSPLTSRGRTLLIWEHRCPAPEVTEPLPYLIDNPLIMASTAAWVRFRDRTLLPRRRPGPTTKFLQCVEDVLALARGNERAPGSLLAAGLAARANVWNASKRYPGKICYQ